jgi:hypothetical protein
VNDREPRSEPSWRLRTYPVVLLVVLGAALVFAATIYDRNDPSSRLGGDYPAFYAAGSIARAGDWDDLYSAARQQSEQVGLIDDEGGYLYFSYPPFVAGAYSVLAGLDYRWSFLFHTLLMALALFVAIRLVWPWLAGSGWPQPAVFVVAIGFYPILRAVSGGQNTALSLLLLAAAARLERDGRSYAAGLSLALLLFKPQYGVGVLLLLLVARRWRMTTGWATGAAVLYTISAIEVGGEWLRDWWHQASQFHDLNVAANGEHFISFPGFSENVLGAGSAVAAFLGYGIALVVAAGAAFYWWQHRDGSVLARYAIAAGAIALAAPQTLYYDAGLLLLGLVLVVATTGPVRSSGRLVFGWLAASWIQVLSGALGWSPLGPLAWMAMGAIYRRAAGQAEPQARITPA